MGVDVERFVATLPEYLTCAVCFDAAWEPFLSCEQNEHVLCQDCWANLFMSTGGGAGAACPTCRAPFCSRAKVSPALKRALASLTLKCKDSRCSWTGSIADDPQHLRTQCHYRPVICKDCTTQYILAEAANHDGVCPNKWIECTRGKADCGGIASGGLFMRKDQNVHDDRCMSYPCTITPSCATRTSRRNLPAHEAQCGDTSRRLKALQAELDMVKQALTRRNAELFALKKEKDESSKGGSPSNSKDVTGTKGTGMDRSPGSRIRGIPFVPTDPSMPAAAQSGGKAWDRSFAFSSFQPTPTDPRYIALEGPTPAAAGQRLFDTAMSMSTSSSGKKARAAGRMSKSQHGRLSSPAAESGLYNFETPFASTSKSVPFASSSKAASFASFASSNKAAASPALTPSSSHNLPHTHASASAGRRKLRTSTSILDLTGSDDLDERDNPSSPASSAPRPGLAPSSSGSYDHVVLSRVKRPSSAVSVELGGENKRKKPD